LNGLYAGLGAGFVGVASRRSRHPNRTDQQTAGFDDQSAADNDRARQLRIPACIMPGWLMANRPLVLLRKVAAVQALPEAVAGVCGPV
jgi:hypothetical protein